MILPDDMQPDNALSLSKYDRCLQSFEQNECLQYRSYEQ